MSEVDPALSLHQVENLDQTATIVNPVEPPSVGGPKSLAPQLPHEATGEHKPYIRRVTEIFQPMASQLRPKTQKSTPTAADTGRRRGRRGAWGLGWSDWLVLLSLGLSVVALVVAVPKGMAVGSEAVGLAKRGKGDVISDTGDVGKGLMRRFESAYERTEGERVKMVLKWNEGGLRSSSFADQLLQDALLADFWSSYLPFHLTPVTTTTTVTSTVTSTSTTTLLLGPTAAATPSVYLEDLIADKLAGLAAKAASIAVLERELEVAKGRE